MQNPPSGVVAYYWLKTAARQPLKLELLDSSGVVRACAASDTPARPPDTETLNVQAIWMQPPMPPSADAGMHRHALGGGGGRGAGFGGGFGRGGGPAPAPDACTPAGSNPAGDSRRGRRRRGTRRPRWSWGRWRRWRARRSRLARRSIHRPPYRGRPDLHSTSHHEARSARRSQRRRRRPRRQLASRRNRVAATRFGATAPRPCFRRPGKLRRGMSARLRMHRESVHSGRQDSRFRRRTLSPAGFSDYDPRPLKFR